MQFVMSPETYRRRLKDLGLSQKLMGEWFGYRIRTSQRWASDGPPPLVALIMHEAGNDAKWLKHLAKLVSKKSA